MISVIIPTCNSSSTLAESLAALIPAAVDGLIRQVIIADGGSSDATAAIADSSGAELLTQAGATRAHRLIAGAAVAKHPWLMFLPADGVVGHDWEREVDEHIAGFGANGASRAAAVFRFAIQDRGMAPRATEAATRIGHGLLGRACGDQGLLISRAHYDSVGGYRAGADLEDWDLIGRIGRGNLVRFATPLAISPQRYRPTGYGLAAAQYGLSVLRSKAKSSG